MEQIVRHLYIYLHIYRNLAEASNYKLPEEIHAPSTTVGSMRRPSPPPAYPWYHMKYMNPFSLPCTTDSAQIPNTFFPIVSGVSIDKTDQTIKKKNFPLNAAGSEEKD